MRSADGVTSRVVLNAPRSFRLPATCRYRCFDVIAARIGGYGGRSHASSVIVEASFAHPWATDGVEEMFRRAPYFVGALRPLLKLVFALPER